MPEPCGLRARVEHSLEAAGMREDDQKYAALMQELEARAEQNGYPGDTAYMLGWLASMYLSEVGRNE